MTRGQAQSVLLITPQKESGYLVGDLLHTEAVITAARHSHLNLFSLPVPGPINTSLELRAIRATETQVNATTQIKIESDYQVFLATDHVMESEIPGYSVKLTTGQAYVPAWSFHVSPLRTLQGTASELPELKPDHGLDPLPTGPAIFRLFVTVCCGAVAATGFTWLRFKPAGFGRKPPFAQACREIKTLRRAKAPIETGFKSLHSAYTQTAGQQVFATDIAAFVETHSNFAPLADETSAFFAASRAQFFARTDAHDWGWEKLVALAIALRRAERTRP